MSDHELQFDTILRNIISLNRNLPDRLAMGLDHITEHARQRAVENAPLWHGVLRSEIKSTPAVRSGDNIQSKIVNDVSYAMNLHEFQIPEGEDYGKGPITRMLPATPEGGPGGGYIRRVVFYHASNYERMLADLVQDL